MDTIYSDYLRIPPMGALFYRTNSVSRDLHVLSATTRFAEMEMKLSLSTGIELDGLNLLQGSGVFEEPAALHIPELRSISRAAC